MDAAQKKVEDAVNKMLSDVDSSHLRKVQGEAFKCCAKCCDDTKSSMEDRQKCIGGCMTTVGVAQDVLAVELNNFQNRIERCVMDCNDQMRDKTGGDDKKKVNLLHDKHYEACVAKCADEGIKLLPNITKKVQTQIGKI